MRRDDRTYRIQSHNDEFRTGVSPEGTQILLVPTSSSRVSCLRFDAAGLLVAAEELQSDSISDTGSNIRIARGALRLEAAAKGIEVKMFSVPEAGVGIRIRPEAFDDFLRDPIIGEPNPHYRERTLRQIREWDAENRFVLTTSGKDYWMNADGSAFAT